MKQSPFKSLPAKKLPKSDREQAVLLGLIELYLKSGKPIGSHTLQENGFNTLSSATIRNYFSKMEEEGYLKQQHTSGGRIPTEKAFRLYAAANRGTRTLEENQEETLSQFFKTERKEIATTLNLGLDLLSEMTGCAVFLSSPRFDQDFIQDVRLVLLDATKLLSVVITDFGLIRTETLYLEKPTTAEFLRTTEEYFLWRMNKGEKPLFRNEAEAKLAQRIYNEVMVRHVVGYANFPHEDILRGGLSKLLAYPEFNDAAALASSLSLLEDETGMEAILRKCIETHDLVTLIGGELCPHVPENSECAVLAVPYKVGQITAGAIALLGPMRLPYKNLYGILELFSDELSRALTTSVYKYKISFRTPASEKRLHTQHSTQIEDQSRNS